MLRMLFYNANTIDTEYAATNVPVLIMIKQTENIRLCNCLTPNGPVNVHPRLLQSLPVSRPETFICHQSRSSTQIASEQIREICRGPFKGNRGGFLSVPLLDRVGPGEGNVPCGDIGSEEQLSDQLDYQGRLGHLGH